MKPNPIWGWHWREASQTGFPQALEQFLGLHGPRPAAYDPFSSPSPNV